MSPTVPPGDTLLSAADLNEHIRALSQDRVVWTDSALAHLARLRTAWRDAVERETPPAA